MSYDEITRELKRLFADIFDISEGEIRDESSQDTIQKWGSFQHLQLIIALEEAFDISLTADEVTEMRTFGDVKSLLMKHKA